MLKAWFEKRNKRLEVDQIEKGFGFAMAQFYLNNEPMRSLIHRCEIAREFDNFTPFDKGIQEALFIIDRREKAFNRQESFYNKSVDKFY